jgi:addiction module RelE/StbE family toxin
MTYVSFFAKGFRKKYHQLPRELQFRCNERLFLFESDPHHPLLNNHLLKGEYEGCRSINITGDYRAIFYYETETSVHFIKVGTHHELFGT